MKSQKVKRASTRRPNASEMGNKLEESITAVEGQPMTFRAQGTNGEQVTLKPLNESWQRFAVYFQVTST